MEGLKKTTSCMIVVSLLFGAALIPVVSASMKPRMINETVNNDFVEEENHPAYYNVTIIRSYGFTREKIVKQISYEDAMKIKQEFENINTNSYDVYQKTIRKNEVLSGYNIIDESLIFEILIKNKFKSNFEKLNINNIGQTSDGILSIPFSILFGELYGLTFNVLNFLTVGLPLFIYCIDGANITNLYMGFIPEFLNVDEPIFLFSSLFVGEIVLIPFIDPNGGIIQGISIWGFGGSVQ